jgi:hypothetical protein
MNLVHNWVLKLSKFASKVDELLELVITTPFACKTHHLGKDALSNKLRLLGLMMNIQVSSE